MDYKKSIIELNDLNFDFEIKESDFNFVQIDNINKNDLIIGKSSKYAIEIFKRFIRNKWAILTFFILLTLILLSILAPIISRNNGLSASQPYLESSISYNLPIRWYGTSPNVVKYDATIKDIENYEKLGILVSKQQIIPNVFKVVLSPFKLKELSNYYPLLGTDSRGVDVWTKLWTAMSKSLGLAVLISFITILIGVIYGSIAGSFGGKLTDTIMMRIVEILGGVPSIVWLLILSIVLTGGSNNNKVSFDNSTITISLIFILWFSPATSVRTFILKNKDVEYVQAAKTLGASQLRIIFSHMIPVIFGKIIVSFVNLVPTIIFYESSLVFLNLKQTSDLGLGVMLYEASQNISNTMLVASPIIAFSCLTISSHILANALNDSIDPRVIGR